MSDFYCPECKTKLKEGVKSQSMAFFYCNKNQKQKIMTDWHFLLVTRTLINEKNI